LFKKINKMEQRKDIQSKDSDASDRELKSTLRTILRLNPHFIYEKFTNSPAQSTVRPVYDNLETNINGSRIPYFTVGFLHMRHVAS
jgi:hypothetical protein